MLVFIDESKSINIGRLRSLAFRTTTRQVKTIPESKGVNDPRPISLQFSPNVQEPIRSRIGYAFRVFAAVYDHAVVEDEEGTGAGVLRIYYGEVLSPQTGLDLFYVPALYHENVFADGGKPPRRLRYAGEEICLACGVDSSSGRPDWLGEIFLWLSSSYERNVSSRDRLGRIPYEQMIFAREGISPRKPHAALLMAWMENALDQGNAKEALPRAPSPISDAEHVVICSHDIDFYYVNRFTALVRLIKNLGVAIVHYRSRSFFFDNLKMTLQLLGGKRIGDYLPALRKAGGEHDFEYTVFVVARQGHRRDPNYRLEQIAGELSGAEEKGISVGVHGSYRSVIEDHTLAGETKVLSKFTGAKVLTNRQHWLRFSAHQVLFEEIERAELLADSTLGFSEAVGFRNGASFAFPPYNFSEERPCEFLEVPLVLMDGSLEAASRVLRRPPQELAEEVLGESRKYGWGGIGLIWHNPIEPLSVPAEINSVFWSCAKRTSKSREKWVSMNQFLTSCIGRYQNAGLLEGMQVEAKSH